LDNLSIIEQGTSDWHKFRAEGIGSSDAAAVLGISPWKTPLQLYEEKVNPKTEEGPTNWAMQRGHEMEPKARAAYEILHDIEMPAALVVHPLYPYIRASLDGYNKERKRILEIKCPGKEDHDFAKKGVLPLKYFAQVQHQLFATGAEACHYWSFDGEAGVLVEVLPDEVFITKLITEEMKFWKMVQDRTPPPPSDRDYVEEVDGETAELLSLWKKAKRKMEGAEAEMESLKEAILSKLHHPRIRACGVKVYRSSRKGAVEYNKIPELRGVNLEIYRKPASEYFTISLDKE
jgi:putative phage-type endonuclease